MHARILELQWFFQMLENIGCKENLTGTFPSHHPLAERSSVWAGRSVSTASTQPAGQEEDAVGPEPSQGMKWLISVTHFRPGFAFKYSCLPLAEAMGSFACG